MTGTEMQVRVNGFGILAGWRRVGRFVCEKRASWASRRRVYVLEFRVPGHKPWQEVFYTTNGKSTRAAFVDGPQGAIETGWRIYDEDLLGLREE